MASGVHCLAGGCHDIHFGFVCLFAFDSGGDLSEDAMSPFCVAYLQQSVCFAWREGCLVDVILFSEIVEPWRDGYACFIAFPRTHASYPAQLVHYGGAAAVRFSVLVPPGVQHGLEVSAPMLHKSLHWWYDKIVFDRSDVLCFFFVVWAIFPLILTLRQFQLGHMCDCCCV